MRFRHLFKQNGLTLIEIVVSIAIIGIIAVAFLPMFTFSYKYIFFAGNKSLSSFQAQDEIENNMAMESSYSSGSLTLEFKNGPVLEIDGGLVDSLKVNAGAESSMTTFLSLIPTMTMNIVELFEGYDSVSIVVDGDRTNFSSSHTTLSIKGKYGFTIHHVPSSIQSIDSAIQRVAININGGLTNNLSPYKITLTTNHQVVSAKLVVHPRFKYVIVGTDSTIFASTDGVTWYSDAWGSNAEFRYVTHGNGVFYAVGDEGKLMFSTAAISWTSSNLSDPDNYNSVYVDNSDVYLVGNNGMIKKSSNLTDWTQISSNTSVNLNKITKFTKFITVGNEGAILTSVDGVGWSDIGISGQNLHSIAWGDNKYVIVGENGTILLSEDDAATFMNLDLDGLVDEDFKSIIYANGNFVAVGQNGTIVHSTNAVDWNKISLTTPVGDPVDNLNSIIWGDGKYIAVGDDNTVISSSNLTHWSISKVSAADISEDIDLQSITYAQN